MISCVMPTYNREEYLAESIESVLMQSEKDFELIVVDDGSTDDTAILMEYYTKKDKRIKYVRSDVNQGIAKTRNMGIRASKGEYIAVMDSDDLCHPDRLKKQLKLLKKGDCDVVYSSYLQADENAKVFAGQEACPKVTKESIINNNSAPHVTIMARRQCFEECPYREEAVVNDDAWLLADWYKKGYRFKRILEPLMIVRYHPNSVSVTRDKEVREIGKLIEAELDGTN